MKIKILKDIPGYKKDEVLDCSKYQPNKYDYKVSYLIEDGYAEEVKEIDIDEIRQYNKWCISDWNNSITFYKDLGEKELEWFSAYRIVSEVIRQLNDQTPERDEVEIYWCVDDGEFKSLCSGGGRSNILPVCNSEKIADEVIRLCEEELKTLFYNPRIVPLVY